MHKKVSEYYYFDIQFQSDSDISNYTISYPLTFKQDIKTFVKIDDDPIRSFLMA
eukprot:403332592